MSKELEALETLKLLKDFVLEYTKNGLDRRFIIGSCDILEKDLEDFECLNNFFEKLKNKYEIDDLDYLEHIVRNYENNKKILEIIKKKGVFVHLLKQSKNATEYNTLMLVAFKKMVDRDYNKAVEMFCLTEIEFSSIKEWLEK